MGDHTNLSCGADAMNAIPSSCAFRFTLLLFTAVAGCAPKPAASDSSAPTDAETTQTTATCKAVIRLSRDKQPAIEVTGLLPEELQALARLEQTPEQWQSLFAVYVQSKLSRSQPAVLGSYRVAQDVLRFEPRFPLMPGVTYRAIFHPDHLPGHTGSSEKPVEKLLPMPKAKVIATTVVEHIYPSADELPENQLKFYLHFSAPMSRGEAYEHIRLLRPDGKADERPFLELPQELWDPDGKRFTLFLDPGRIKRGLKPREDLGPVLLTGGTYTLVIDSEWKDAKGNPLKEPFRKTFRVLPPDETQPGPKTWTIEAPESGTTMPFEMTSIKPLDHALMQRMLWITDDKGRKVPGKVDVTKQETCWRFTPTAPWKAGRYYLVADTRLEDLAGNSIARPFEVDMLNPVEQQIKTETVQIPFEVP
jgi:hypothetical protein